MSQALTITSVVCAITAHGQGFNVVNLPTNNEQSRGVSVRETPEGFLVFSDKFDGDLQYRVHTEMHDWDGALLWEQAWMDAAQSMYGYNDAASKPLPDGGFLASVAVHMTDSVLWRAYRFTVDHDTAWTRTLEGGYFVYPRAAAHQAGRHYFAALLKETEAADNKAVVARLNEAGEVQQIAEFPQIEFDLLTLAPGLDGDLFMAGGEAGSVFPFRSLVMRLDTALGIVWTKPILTTISGFSGCSSYVSKVAHDADGNVLVGGTTFYEYVTPGIPLAEFYILKLARTNGNVIWSRRFPVSMSDFGSLHDLECLPDNDLVACGYVTPHDEAGFRACIYRYQPDGIERWHRYYRFLTNPDAFHQLVDVEPTSDGGFILTGTTQLSLQFPTVLWLLRLDEHGCVEPGCQHVGVEEVVLDMPEEAIRLGPVPAHLHVTLLIDLPESYPIRTELRAVLTDAQGRVVHRIALGTAARSERSIDLQAFLPGVYVVHVADGDRLLAARRLIIE